MVKSQVKMIPPPLRKFRPPLTCHPPGCHPRPSPWCKAMVPAKYLGLWGQISCFIFGGTPPPPPEQLWEAKVCFTFLEIFFFFFLETPTTPTPQIFSFLILVDWLNQFLSTSNQHIIVRCIKASPSRMFSIIPTPHC